MHSELLKTLFPFAWTQTVQANTNKNQMLLTSEQFYGSCSQSLSLPINNRPISQHATRAEIIQPWKCLFKFWCRFSCKYPCSGQTSVWEDISWPCLSFLEFQLDTRSVFLLLCLASSDHLFLCEKYYEHIWYAHPIRFSQPRKIIQVWNTKLSHINYTRVTLLLDNQPVFLDFGSFVLRVI